MKGSWWAHKRYRWLVYGLSLSFIGPLGEWVFLQFFTVDPEEYVKLSYLYVEILSLIVFACFGYFLGKKADYIQHIAAHDALTGVHSRGYLMQRLQEMFAFQKRYHAGFALIMLDLDYFKKVNDVYGHQAGDRALKAVAQCVVRTCRDTDVVGRYGGEEFIVACPELKPAEGQVLAERIRQSVAELPEELLGYPGPQTVSVAITSVPGDNVSPLKDIMKRLDLALYVAKTGGRNRVSVAE